MRLAGGIGAPAGIRAGAVTGPCAAMGAGGLFGGGRLAFLLGLGIGARHGNARLLLARGDEVVGIDNLNDYYDVTLDRKSVV